MRWEEYDVWRVYEITTNEHLEIDHKFIKMHYSEEAASNSIEIYKKLTGREYLTIKGVDGDFV